MSVISAALPSTEKVHEKESTPSVTTITAVFPRLQRRGLTKSRGRSGQKGLPMAGDMDLRSHTFLSPGSASLRLCVTPGWLLRLS